MVPYPLVHLSVVRTIYDHVMRYFFSENNFTKNLETIPRKMSVRQKSVRTQ